MKFQQIFASGRRKRSALILLVSLAVAIGLGISLITIRAPISVALWFVESYPEYFERESEYDPLVNYSILDRILVKGVAYKLLHDWASMQARPFRISRNSSNLETYETVSSLVDMVRGQVLNQAELPHTAVGQPSFSRLINGYAYCGGVNQLLAFPLSEIFNEVYMFTTRYPEVGVSASAAGKSTHVNVQFEVSGVQVYADAWSSIPLFKLEDARLALNDVPFYEQVHAKVPLVFDLPELSSVSDVGTLVEFRETGKISGLTEAAFESLLHASSGGILRRSAYTNGEARSLTRSRPLQFARIALKQEVSPSQFIHLYRDDLFMLYLIARVFHIYDERDKAQLLYREIRDSNCQETFCRAAAVFIRR